MKAFHNSILRKIKKVTELDDHPNPKELSLEEIKSLQKDNPYQIVKVYFELGTISDGNWVHTSVSNIYTYL